eukprot:EG_transcript_22831
MPPPGRRPPPLKWAAQPSGTAHPLPAAPASGAGAPAAMPARSEAIAGWAVTTMEVLHPDGSPVTPPAELARHDPATLHLRLRHAAPATAALRLRLGRRAAGGAEVHTVQEVALEPLHGCIRLNGGQGDAELVRWHAVLHPPVDATLDRPFALAALALLLGLALCTLSLPAFTVLAATARYALRRGGALLLLTP